MNLRYLPFLVLSLFFLPFVALFYMLKVARESFFIWLGSEVAPTPDELEDAE